MNRWPGYWQGPAVGAYPFNRYSRQSKHLLAWAPALWAPGSKAVRFFIADRKASSNWDWQQDSMIGRTWYSEVDSGVYVQVLEQSTYNCTITCWVSVPTLSEHGGFANWGYTTGGWAVGVGSGTMESSGNNIILLAHGIQWRDTGIALGTSRHFLAVSVSPAAVFSVYLDGVFVHSWSRTYNAPTPGVSLGTAWYTGPRLLTHGTVGEVRWYSKALTASEIWQLYAPETRWELYESLLPEWSGVLGGWAFNPVWDGRGVIGSNVVTGV